MRSVIIGTAGHIDHGKSALVAALTGTQPDRLAEEQRRGITIELGFAHLALPGLQLAFVDVPGHERFVGNMLAGAGGVDLVLLVIAADEGVKPQTREHFDICRLLGLERGMVVVTKADLVDDDALQHVCSEVQTFIHGTFLAAAPLVTVSTRSGAGLERLRQQLQTLAADSPRRAAGRPPRLPIDRVFTIKGFGTVVTGTLLSGRLAPDTEVEVLGGGAPARRLRVRRVEVHGQTVAEAVAGQRVAVNLAAVGPSELARGLTLTTAGVFRPSTQLDVQLTLLAGVTPLKNRSRVHLHVFSAETVAEVVLFERDRLAAGQTAPAQLRLAEPLLAWPGDRFVVRQFSPMMTLGGGGVVDNLPVRHRPSVVRQPEFLAAFQALTLAAGTQRLEWLLERAGGAGLGLAELAAASGQLPAELARELAPLESAQRVVQLPGHHFFATDQLNGLLRATEIAARARLEPLASGVAPEDLRLHLGVPQPPTAAVYRHVLEILVRAGRFQKSGELYSPAGRQVVMSPAERAAREQMEAAFQKAGLQAPAVKDVLAALPLDRATANKVLHLLLREKVLVKVSEELIVHGAALDAFRAQLARRKLQSPRLDVAAFKALTGVSRKYAIPLLEYLDQTRVTRRVGDAREIL